MTRADLLQSNRDLMAYCVSLLHQMPLSHLAFEVHAADSTLRVTTRGIERLDLRFDDVPVPSVKPKDNQRFELRWPAGTRRVELIGVSRRKIVQRRLIDLRR